MISFDIHTISDLESFLLEQGLTWEDAHLPSKDVLEKQFSMRIPRFYAKLINWKDEDDPLRKQVVPTKDERNVKTYELTDPIGDHTHEPVPGLIHRYPDRCLLLLTTHCSIHCRFCFRRDVIGTPLPMDIVGIEEYLKQHDRIHEVILTGGDPVTLPPAFLRNMLDRLSRIPHIDTYRFHTRSMVVDPEYVTQEWLQELASIGPKKKIVVLHINHPKEVTPELEKLVSNMKQMGIDVLSQSVLLKGVNDFTHVLTELFTSIARAGITPYYLHHLDKARGTHHFRISIDEGKKIFSALRGTISGYCIPEYVIDLPGGDGKVPVMWLRSCGAGVYEVENFEGKTVQYLDPIKTL